MKIERIMMTSAFERGHITKDDYGEFDEKLHEDKHKENVPVNTRSFIRHMMNKFMSNVHENNIEETTDNGDVNNRGKKSKRKMKQRSSFDLDSLSHYGLNPVQLRGGTSSKVATKKQDIGTILNKANKYLNKDHMTYRYHIKNIRSLGKSTGLQEGLLEQSFKSFKKSKKHNRLDAVST